ncbi:LOW QUALITY PROTEIN: protein S100-A16 [Microcaecilia unicolor]|uniref:Protein S100 n=1 Tax=Microcaecilia unicolor TaxID=1415580 RepID=A0A6P7WWV1_9AMPH|nr:LOW QUALITY PROTEIN: protein S100-A16 [Microcaecilia unicolor]
MASSCSELEKSIEVLVRNFYKYAEKKGKKDKMTKKEFRKMVGSELNHILTNTQSKEGADKLIKSLDADEDGKISFDEVLDLIVEIAKELSQANLLQIQDAPQSSQSGN